jgi:hypothetical protein
MIDRISRAERKEAMRAMREAQRKASEPGGSARAAGEHDEVVPDASPA